MIAVMEVLRWVSLVSMWLVVGLNIVVMIRGIRLNKRLEVAVKHANAAREAYEEMMESELKKCDADITEIIKV